MSVLKWLESFPLVDPRPTAADHPWSVKDFGELSQNYQDVLVQVFEHDLTDAVLVFSPRFPYRRDRREYLLAQKGDILLYCERNGKGQMNNTMIAQNQVIALYSCEDLLLGELVVYFLEDGHKIRNITVRYNRSRKELYLPYLDWVFCNSSWEVTQAQKDSRPDTLRQEQYGLYNYSLDAFRLGNIESSWHWEESDWKKGGLFPAKVHTDGLLCSMERGKVIITLEKTKVESWYFLKDKRIQLTQEYQENTTVFKLNGIPVATVHGRL